MNKMVTFKQWKLSQNSYQQLCDWITETLKKGQSASMLSMNPEIWIHSLKHTSFTKTLQQADILLPDGIGLSLANKIWRKKPIKKRSGSELIFYYLNHGHYPVYLLGASNKNNNLAIKNLKNKHVHCLGGHDGFFNENTEQLIEILKRLPVCLVLCGLGYPKQEQFIQELCQRAKKEQWPQAKVFLACGGMIDVLAGAKPFAPKWLRDCRLEWLYSGIAQPQRIKRWLVWMPRFFIELIKGLFL